MQIIPKPAKFEAHQFLQGWSCSALLLPLPILLSALPSFPVSHSQSFQPFIFEFQNTTADLAF
jgi:hypothetical protein